MSWFDGIDWKLLEGKKIAPSMRPEVSLPSLPSSGVVLNSLYRARETLILHMSLKRSSWRIIHYEPSGGQKILVQCPRK